LRKKYIPVSIGIVLLMQSVWMLLEMFLERASFYSKVVMVIIAFRDCFSNKSDSKRSYIRLARHHVGDGSSVFTTTMFTANRVASNISSAQRSLYMLLGCCNRIFISIVTQVTPFNFCFLKWE
jgi:hypothetical protein